jgi:hypothetical protein
MSIGISQALGLLPPYKAQKHPCRVLLCFIRTELDPLSRDCDAIPSSGAAVSTGFASAKHRFQLEPTTHAILMACFVRFLRSKIGPSWIPSREIAMQSRLPGRRSQPVLPPLNIGFNSNPPRMPYSWHASSAFCEAKSDRAGFEPATTRLEGGCSIH